MQSKTEEICLQIKKKIKILFVLVLCDSFFNN